MGEVWFDTRETHGPCVVFDGEIDMEAAQSITRHAIAEWVVTQDPVTVDMSACSFMDSTGVGLLVRIRNASEHNVRLLGIGPVSARLLRVTGLMPLFDIVPA